MRGVHYTNMPTPQDYIATPTMTGEYLNLPEWNKPRADFEKHARGYLKDNEFTNTIYVAKQINEIKIDNIKDIVIQAIVTVFGCSIAWKLGKRKGK